MAKIQAQKWQHTGKALTLQTRTQIKQCLVHTRNYSTPLDHRSILKKWLWLLVALATVTNGQRVFTKATGYSFMSKEKEKKKKGWHPWTIEGKENLSPNFKKDYLVKVCFQVFTAVMFYKQHHGTTRYCSYLKAVWETWSCKYVAILTQMEGALAQPLCPTETSSQWLWWEFKNRAS